MDIVGRFAEGAVMTVLPQEGVLGAKFELYVIVQQRVLLFARVST